MRVVKDKVHCSEDLAGSFVDGKTTCLWRCNRFKKS